MNKWFINNYDTRSKSIYNESGCVSSNSTLVSGVTTKDTTCNGNTQIYIDNIETNSNKKRNWNKIYFNLLDYILLFIPILPNHVYARLSVVIIYIYMNKYYSKIKQMYIIEGDKTKTNLLSPMEIN